MNDAPSLNFLPLARPGFSPEELARVSGDVRDILQSGVLTSGPHQDALQGEMITAVGRKYALVVNTGLSAMILALQYCDLKDREVIVSGVGPVAAANAVLLAGGMVIFADIDPDTMALCPDTLEPLLSERTAAVIQTHPWGKVSPDVTALKKLCFNHGVLFLEEATEAFGARWDGHPVGAFGGITVLDCGPESALSSGGGGLVLTDVADPVRYVTQMRDMGRDRKTGRVALLGANLGLSELDCALIQLRLRALTGDIAARRKVAARYAEAFRGHSRLTIPRNDSRHEGNALRFIVRLTTEGSAERDALVRACREKHAVGAQSLGIPIYSEPLYRAFEPYTALTLLGVETLLDSALLLPIFATMTELEVERVVSAVLTEFPS